MRVLLVPPKSNYPDPRPSRDVFGLGFPYVAAALKAAGHEVFGVNLGQRWCHGGAPLTLDIELKRAIARCRPQLIGLGGLAPDYRFLRDAICLCRRIAPDVPVVCGGGVVSHDAEHVFAALKPDFGIVGDGEVAIASLAHVLEAGGRDVATVSNLMYWRDGEARFTFEETVDDLDSLPFPDYDPFDVERQFETAVQGDCWLTTYKRRHPRAMSVSLARSCPFRCTFCCHKTAQPYRSRSVPNAVAEIIALYERYRFNILAIQDELFATAGARVEEFCEAVIEAKREHRMDFDWTCSLRVTTATDRARRMLRLMKQSGCAYVGFGIESGSQKILDSMKKGITVADTVRAMRLTDEEGMGVQGCLILGDPAETEETIRETVDFYRTHCTRFLVNYAYVTAFPGSTLLDDALARGVIPGKSHFYDRISNIGQRSYNLTALDDATFARLTAAAIEESCTSPFQAPVTSWTEEPGPGCDADAPFGQRRDLCRITMDCPHCGSTLERTYAMMIEYSAGLRLPCACDRCNKRFDAVLPSQVPPELREASKRRRLPEAILHPDFEGDPEALFVYLGYVFVRFARQIYLLPLSVGAVNFHSEQQRSQPGIHAVASIEQGLAYVNEQARRS